MRKFTADFETSTPEWLIKDEKARVWAYSICEIDNTDNFIYGNNIEDFMKFCANTRQNYLLYFHNLKYDAQYILNWLFENGFEHIKDKKFSRDKTFTTLISDMGMFYSIEIYFKKKGKHINKVTIYDSLKILNFSVDKIAKDFNLPVRKLNLDYTRYRPVGYELKPYEIEYIKNDVKIMALALKIMFDENLTKMTIGSNALANYREMTPKFEVIFPQLDIDLHQIVKKSYRGGFTYLNPTYENKEVENIIVLDVNSLYPSVMAQESLPYGQPILYEGKYEEDLLYPLYIQVISCSFELKENMIPTIQIKNNIMFLANEYLKSSNGEIITLTLTSVDLDLFLKHYNVKDLTYEYGFKFMSRSGMFETYINFWSERKIQAKKDNNDAIYKISKLMLNSLYGKFGTSVQCRSKYPYYEDGQVKYEMSDIEIRKPVYIPVACFITSLSRKKTIETSQAIRDYTLNKYNKDYYIYSDTDSIHMIELPEEELKQFVDIDDYRLGAWKLESKAKRGKFIRQKCYIEEGYDGFINTAVAGLPKSLGKYITFENFERGFSVLASEIEKQHKLRYKTTKGGVVLVDTDFTIK